MEKRNQTPHMLRLLMDHFRRIVEPGAFYSLPWEFFEAIGGPGKEVKQALQNGTPDGRQAQQPLTENKSSDVT